MGGKAVFTEMWKLIRSLIDDAFVVSEREIGRAVQMILQNNKILVEGSAAATIAVIIKHGEFFRKFNKIVCVMSGGNLDESILIDILQDRLK